MHGHRWPPLCSCLWLHLFKSAGVLLRWDDASTSGFKCFQARRVWWNSATTLLRIKSKRLMLQHLCDDSTNECSRSSFSLHCVFIIEQLSVISWLTCVSTATNNKCQAAVCECDRVAAHCFAQASYNPENKNLDPKVHCVHWVIQPTKNTHTQVGFLTNLFSKFNFFVIF